MEDKTTDELLDELRAIGRRKNKISNDRADVEKRLRGCGIWGIAVDTDPLAIEWQAQEKRKVEILKELRIYGI
jgi:hypothetical protein